MSNRSRDKGLRIERELVHLHTDAGIACERVPLSGAAGGSFFGDLLVADTWVAEVKARGNGVGFKTLHAWLGTNDLLFLRMDHARPFVAMTWEMYITLLKQRREA